MEDGGSVEEDGVGVSVGDLSHVFQDVFLSDDSQQPPEGDKKKKVVITSYHTLFALSRKVKRIDRKQRCEWRSGLVLVSDVLLRSQRGTGTQQEIRVRHKHNVNTKELITLQTIKDDRF